MTTRREQMITQLVDAAEALLADSDTLTAGAVAQRVGVARNSLYRYIDSIDDLRGLVIQRHLPSWVDAVEEAVAENDGAEDRLSAYLRANLRQAAIYDHSLLTRVAHDLPPESLTDIGDTHIRLRDMLIDLCSELDPVRGPRSANYVQAVLQAGFEELKEGVDLEEVTDLCVAAGLAVVRASGGRR